MLRQVLLRKPSLNGYKEDVFWIDNELAIKGKRVQNEAKEIWTVVVLYNAKPFDDIENQIAAWAKFAAVLDGH